MSLIKEMWDEYFRDIPPIEHPYATYAEFLGWIHHYGCENEIEDLLAHPMNVDTLETGLVFEKFRIKSQYTREREVCLVMKYQLPKPRPILSKPPHTYIGSGSSCARATIKALLVAWELGMRRQCKPSSTASDSTSESCSEES